MSKKSYKLKKRFYAIIIIIVMVILVAIFRENIKSGIIAISKIGKEKRVEMFNPDIVKETSYFIFTKEDGYAVYADKMSIKFSKNLKFNKDKKFIEMLKAENYREIVNYYNLNVPEKINSYYLADNVSDDLDSYSINVPIIEVNGEHYIDSRVLSDIFIYRYYGIDYKESESEYKIYADIVNATEKEKYNGETVKKLRKVGYICKEVNYGEVLNHSVLINNKSTIDELKKFVLSVNEKYIKTEEEMPFSTTSDIVFIAGSENESRYTFKIYGKKKNELFRTLNALGYSELKRMEDEIDIKESFVRCSKKDYYTAYKVAKLAKIADIKTDSNDENEIEITIN